MEFDLSAVALVNAGGAFLFLLAGLAILALARRTRLGLRLGLFATAFGASYTVVNVVNYTSDAWAFLVPLVPGLVATASLVALIVEVSRPLSPKDRRRLLWLSLAVGASLAIATTALVVHELGQPDHSSLGANAAAFVLILMLEPALLLLLAACGMDAGSSPPPYRARLLMGLAAGLFVVNIVMDNAASPTFELEGAVRTAVDVAAFLVGVVGVAAGWFVLRGGPDRAFARRAFVAVTVVALAGCILPLLRHQPSLEPLGAIFGVLRTFGVVLLAIAVVKYDLLGVPLPRIVVKRGVVAGAALAALFIVAQVLQNFLSAEYGLLMGGIVAGTFLFAASPIQKAVERLGERHVAVHRAIVDASGDETFRAAAELAFKDRRFTPKEELALAKLATRLGVSAERATEIRHQVERGAR